MQLSSVYYKEAPYILIGVGAVITLVGSFGCCCTFRGNSPLLYLYSTFLVLVFIIELSCGVAGFVYKSKMETGFSEGLDSSIQKYGLELEPTKAWDGLQDKLHCCGKTDYTDWFATPWEKTQVNKTNIVPQSCCIGDVSKCVNHDLPSKLANQTYSIYTEGCYHTVTNFMQKNMALIGGVALGISFFQLLGAALACCLAKNINKAKYEQVK